MTSCAQSGCVVTEKFSQESYTSQEWKESL